MLVEVLGGYEGLGDVDVDGAGFRELGDVMEKDEDGGSGERGGCFLL